MPSYGYALAYLLQTCRMLSCCTLAMWLRYLVVAVAVAHGMRILALDDWAVLCGDVAEGDALINASIHGTDDVCGVCA